jgi:hypothetical protein
MLFPDTAYTLLGFASVDRALNVILKQPFISSGSTAGLNAIKELLTYNGFQNTKRQDYFNAEYGLIL